MAEGALSAGTISMAVKPDTSTFAAKLKAGISSGTQGVGEHMGGIIRDGLRTMAGPIAAVTAGFGVTKLVESSIDSFESLAGEVGKIQRVAGGTTEQISGLRGAMQLAGVPTDQLATLMTRFAKNLSDADIKGNKAGESLNALGIKVRDAHNNVRPMAELLPEISDRFKEMPNGADKTALAIQLFGRQGAQLLPFLNKGSAGIAELTDKAKGMGLVLDDKATAAAKRAKAEQREFNATLQGLSVTMGQALLPVMEGVAGVFRDVLAPLIQRVTAWVKQHQAAFDELGKRLKAFLLPIVNQVITGIKNLVNWIIQNRNWLTAIGVAVLTFVGIMKGYQLAMTIATVASKAWAIAQGIFRVVTGAATLAQLGFNASLLANPIVLIIAAIAALVAGLIWFFTQTKVGQQAFKALGDAVGAVFKFIGGIFAWLYNNIVKPIFAAIGVVIGIFVNIFKFYFGLVGAYIHFVAGIFTWLYKNIIQPIFHLIGAVISWVWKSIISPVFNWIANAVKTAGQTWHNIFTGMVNTVKNVFGAIVGFVKAPINMVIGLINGMIDSLNGVHVKVPDWVPGLGGKTFGFNIAHIPALAEGGVVPATPGGRIVRVAEAGESEAVIPLSKMASVLNLSADQGRNHSRPIVADGIGLIGVLKQTARGEAKLVFNTELNKAVGGTR